MKLTLFSIVITLLLIGCQKTEDITPDVQFLKTGFNGFFGECFGGIFSLSNEAIVIRNQEEYKEVFEKNKNTFQPEKCENVSLPSIDFQKHTLIGKITMNTGCSTTYDRRVEQRGNQETIYHITITETGGCQPSRTTMNWALIPKIKKRTDVTFNVATIRQ